MVLSRARHALAGPARSLVTSRSAAPLVSRTGGSLARHVPQQGPAAAAAAPAAPAAGRLVKPYLAMNAPAHREHATAVHSKLGAVRTDWT